MSQKNTLKYPLVSGQSLAASFNTTPTICRLLDNFSYQIKVVTSNSTGSFQVQASNDYEVNNEGAVTNVGTWTNLTLAGGTPTVAGANDSILINLNQLPFNAVRLAYTSTVAGTGTADITIVAKRLGG